MLLWHVSLVTAVLLVGQQSNVCTTFNIIRRHRIGCGEVWHAGNGQCWHAQAVFQAVAHTCGNRCMRKRISAAISIGKVSQQVTAQT